MPKHEQLVLVEFRNCSPYLCRLVSNKLITIDRVSHLLAASEGFDEQTDSITFIDDKSPTNMDDWEVVVAQHANV